MKRWIVTAGAVVLLAITAGMGWWGYQSGRAQTSTPDPAPPTTAVTTCDVQQSISAPGSVVITREEILQMPAEGRLAEVLVRPGDQVTQGQVLARLADPEKYAADLADAHLALLEAQRGLEELASQAPVKTAETYTALLDARKELEAAQSRRLSKAYQRASDNTIDIARANLMLAKGELDKSEQIYAANRGRDDTDPEKAAALSRVAHARQEYDRHKANLEFLMNGPSDMEIQQADTAIQLAEARLKVAEEDWARVKDGPDPLDLEQAQAAVDQAAARMKIAQAVVDSVEIKAPFAGVVTEVNARPGASLAAATSLFTLTDPQAVEVESNVTEEDYPLISSGQPVELFFDALPDESIAGKVVSIVPRRIAGDSPRYLIRLSLDRVPDKLVDGMSADATVVIEQRQGVLCLPRALVRSGASAKAQVEVWTGSAREKREISVGLRGDTNVEILAGLKKGELVVTK